MGIARSLLSWLLLGALACAAFAGLTASASAATPSTSYGYKGDIGTPDSGEFGVGLINPIAVSNDDGRVFIVRETSNAIEVVDDSGTSIVQVPTELLPGAVAASSDGSTLFYWNGLSAFGPPELFGPPIRKLTSDGAPTPTYTEDSSWSPSVEPTSVAGMAVDPGTGDLVLATGAGIYRFDADTGALISSFDGSTSDRGPFKSASTGAASIAVATNGDVYVVVGPERVEHMGSDGSWKGELKVKKPDAAIKPSGIAVNPQNGDVAVELLQGGETVIKLYTSANDLKDTIRVPLPSNGANYGLAYAGDGSKLYIGLNNGSAHVFALGTRPGADPPVASDITTTGAHLTATVATGGEPTAARIEYCVPIEPCGKFLGSEGASPWHVVSEETGLSGPGQDTVSGDLAGLEPNSEYLLRTTAVNEAGQVEGISATGSFRTVLVPPTVQTGQASAVTDTSAEVAGTIATVGSQTTYHFEYGPTTSYGSKAPANAEGIAGSERSPRTFTETLKGLQPGTTYHYRLVATNAAGTTAGEDRTFTTLGADEVAPRRGYEMVTPPVKNGFVMNASIGFQASADGSAMVYSGFAAPSDASSSPLLSTFMSRREPSGWTGLKPLDPPLNPVRSILLGATQAVSDDFEHTLVFSQKALTPDAVEDAANIYVNDVDTGDYHLVGTATQSGAFGQMTGPVDLNHFIAAAPDFSWVVLISRYPLLPGAPQVAMYKWTRTDGLSLVSLLPGDTVPTGRSWSQRSQTVNRLVSDDGETFAFALTTGESGAYRRSGGETEAVSVSQASGGPAGVQPGIVDGMSRDGRYVVFHSEAKLTDSASDAGPKMYRYDSSLGQLEYLGPQDGTDDGTLDVLGIGDDGRTVYFNSKGHLVVWRDGHLDDVHSGPVRIKTYGYQSPNGRFLAFLSGDGSVRLYDAVTGESTCMSCSVEGPGGASLTGLTADRYLSNRFVQVVTDDGHAYFNATAALVGADRNATSDVYEYYNGRLTLISPGDGEFVATLADITPDGNSVYFTTAEGLVGQDTDQSYDVYVARVGGGFAEPPAPPADCSGEACRGSAAAPAGVNIGSSASGRSAGSKPNRQLNCRKGTHKVRRNGKARCVKNKRQAKKRETKHNRGAGR